MASVPVSPIVHATVKSRTSELFNFCLKASLSAKNRNAHFLKENFGSLSTQPSSAEKDPVDGWGDMLILGRD